MKSVPLGEIVNFYSGGTPAKSRPDYWIGDVPWFSAKDMKRPRLSDSADHISDEVFRATALRKVPAGTIAIVVRGMILAHTIPISILDVDAAINQDLKALLPKRDIDVSYLAAMLHAQHSSLLNQVSTAAHGTKKLESRVLEEIPVPLPSLPEQRRIAAILDYADALRGRRRQLLAHLELLTQSIFTNMFGSLGPSTTVGEVAAIQSGLQVSASRQSLPLRAPYLRVANAHRGRLDLSEVKTIQATEAEIRRTCLLDGDLLFVEGHANPLEVGRVSMWENQIAGCIHQNHLIRGRFDRSRVLPVVAMTWLNSNEGARHFRRAGKTTSGLNTISTMTVGSAPLLEPPMPAQSDFAARIDRVEVQRRVVQRALAADNELIASLQARAFQGKL